MLIVKLVCLILGTALGALFILFTLRGKKEDWRIEGVPQKEFSDKELWAAGFAMQQLPAFSMDAAVGKKMMSASAILHPENGGRFVEYWACPCPCWCWLWRSAQQCSWTDIWCLRC